MLDLVVTHWFRFVSALIGGRSGLKADDARRASEAKAAEDARRAAEAKAAEVLCDHSTSWSVLTMPSVSACPIWPCYVNRHHRLSKAR
jgi:hypothetical protein